MTLIRTFQDPSQPAKKRKRCLIACERCGSQKEAQYKYYLETERKQIKYCKPCKERILAEEAMDESNMNQPLSICLELTSEDGKLYGLFECTSCGKARKRVHSKVPYTQLCNHCVKIGVGRKHTIKHNDRLARIYRSMKDRCYNENIPQFKYYGAKGVTISNEWLEDRTKFYDWALANGYGEHLQIDKDKICIEQDIHPPIYSAETCTWLTHEENSQYHPDYSSSGK